MTAHHCHDCGHDFADDLTATTAPDATPAEDDDDAPPDDWAPVDLAPIAEAIRRGDIARTLPTVLQVADHLPLFYRARINQLFGESGGGKSWVGIQAVAEVVTAGQRALVVDWEDNPHGIAERLVQLGVDQEAIARVDYRNPSGAISTGLERFDRGPYGIALVDSTGEAMAAGGVNSNDDGEVAQWFAIVKRMTRLPGGPAVVTIDHVPKDKEAPSAYAIGSQRKRAAVTGASYRVDTLKEPARGRDGKLKLTTAKDRLGNRAKGSIAAEVHLHASDDGSLRIELAVSEAQAATERGEKFRPTHLMERVSRYVEATPGATRRAIVDDCQGKHIHLRAAIDCLVEDGWMLSEGRGYRVVNPYREPVDISSALSASHASQRVPSASRDAADNPQNGARPTRPGHTYSPGRGTRPEGVGEPTEPPTSHHNASPVDNPSLPYVDDGPF